MLTKVFILKYNNTYKTLIEEVKIYMSDFFETDFSVIFNKNIRISNELFIYGGWV